MSDSGLFGSFGAFFGGGGGKKQPQQQNFFDDLGFEELAQQLKTNLPSQQAKYGSLTSGTTTAEVGAVTKPSQEENNLEEDIALSEHDLQDGWGSIGSDDSNQQIGEINDKKDKMIEEIKEEDKGEILFPTKIVVKEKKEEQQNIKQLQAKQKQQQILQAQQQQQQLQQQQQQYARQASQKRAGRSSIKELDRIEEEGKLDQSGEDQTTESDVSSQHAKANNKKNNNTNSNCSSNNNMNTAILQGLIPQKQQQHQQQAVYVPSTSVTAVSSSVKEQREHNNHHFNDTNTIQLYPKQEQDHQKQQDSQSQQQQQNHQQQRQKQRQPLEYRAQLIQPQSESSLSNLHLKQLLAMEDLISSEREELAALRIDQENKLQMWTEDLNRREGIISEQLKQRNLLDTKLHIKTSLLKDEHELRDLIETKGTLAEENQQLVKEVQLLKSTHQKQLQEIKLQNDKLQEKTQFLLHREQLMKTRLMNVLPKKGTLHKQLDELKDDVLDMMASVKNESNIQLSELSSRIKTEKNTMAKVQQQIIKLKTELQQKEYEIQKLQVKGGELAEDYKRSLQVKSKEYEEKVIGFNQQKNQLKMEFEEQLKKERETRYHLQLEEIADIRKKLQKDIDSHKEKEGIDEKNRGEKVKQMKEKEQKIVGDRKKIEEEQEKNKIVSEENKKIKEKLEQLERNIGNEQLKLKEGQDRLMENTKKQEQQGEKLNEEMKKLNEQKKKLEGDVKRLDEDKKKVDMEKEEMKKEKMEVKKEKMEIKKQKMEIKKEKEEIEGILLDQRNKVREEYEESREKKERQEEQQQQQYQQQQIVDWNVEKDDKNVEKKEEIEDEGEQIQNNDKMIQETINEEKDYQNKDESTDKWNTEGEEQVELSVGRARSSVAQSSSMKSAEKATENMVEEIEQQNGTTYDARDKDKSHSWEHMLANNGQLDPKEGFKLEGEKIITKEIDVIPEISTEKVEKVKEIILTAQEPIGNYIDKDIKPHKKDQTTSDDSFFFSLLNSKSEMNIQSQTQQSQQKTANPTVPEVDITPVGVVVTPTSGTSAASKAKVGVKHLADDSLFSELLNDNNNNNNKSQIDSSVGTSSTKEKQQKTSVVPAPDDVFALLLSDQPISKKKPTKTKKGTKKTTEITNKNANIDFFAEDEVKKQQEQVIPPPKATVNLNEKRETLLNEQNSENKEVIGFENIKNTDFSDDLRQVSQTTPLKSDVKSPEKGVTQVKDNIEVINKNILEENGNQEKIKLDEKIIEVSADKKIVNVSNDNKSKSKINFFEIPKVNENDIVWDFKLPTKSAATIVTASKEHTFMKEEIKPLEEMVKQENPFEIKNGLKIDSQQTAEIKDTQKDIIETVKQSDILDILHPEATKTKKEKKKKPKNDNSNNNNNADDFFEQLLRKKKSERQEQEHQETNVSGWLSQDIIVGNDKQKAKKEEIKQQQQEVAKNQLEVDGIKDQNKEQQQTINEEKVKDIEDNKDGWKETDIFDCVKEPEEIEKHETEDNKKKKEQEQIDELPIQDTALPVEISIEDKSNKISEVIQEQEDKSHNDQDKEEQKQLESDLIKSSNVSPKKEDNNINETTDAQPSQQLETNLNDKSIEKISPREEPSSPNQQQQSPEDNLESQLSQASENEDNQSGLYPNTDTDSGDVPLTFSQPQKKDQMKEQFLASLRQPKFQFNYFSNRQNLNKSPSRSPLRQSHHSNRSPQRQKQLQPQKIKQSLHASEDRLDSNQEFRNNAMSDPSMNQSASMASMSPQRKPMQQTFNISQDLHALDLSYQPHAGLDISAPQAMLDLSAHISNQQIHNNIQPSHNIDITSLDSRQMFMNLSGQYQGAMDLSGNHQIMDLSIGNQQAVMDLSASVKEGSLRVLGSKVDLSNQGSPTLIGGKWKQRGGPGNYNKRVHSGNNSICEENSINGGMNVLDLDSIEDFPDKRRKSSFHNRSLGLSNALSDHFITSSHHMIDLFIADQQKHNQNNQHNCPVSCQPKSQQQQQQQPNGSSSSPWESQNFIKLLSSKHKLSENLSDADMNTPVNNLNFQGNNQAVSGSDGNNNNKITILSTLMPRTISQQRQLRSPSEPRIQSTSPHRRLSADSRGSQKSKKQTKMSMFSCSDGQLPFQMQKQQQQQQEQELETSQTPIGSEMDAQMFTGIDQSPAYLGIQEREDSQKYQEDLLLGEEINSQVLKGKIEENEKTCDGEIDKEEEIKEEKREIQIEERIDNEQRNLDGNNDGIEGVREINGDNNVNEEEMNGDELDQEEKKDLGDQQELNEPQDLKEIEINEQQQIKEEKDDSKEPNIQTDTQEKTNNLCQPVSDNADELDLDDGWGENQIKENEEENEIKEAEGDFMDIPQAENEELDDADNLKVSEKKEEINSNNNQLDLERAAEEALLQVDSEKEIDDKWGDTPLTTKQLFNTFPSRKTSKQIGAEEVVVEEQEDVQHGQQRKQETDSVGQVKEDKESGWERDEEVEIQEKDLVLKDEQDIQQESEKITEAAMLMNEVAVEEKNEPEIDEDLGLDNPWESSYVPDIDQVDETSQKSALPTDQLLFSNIQQKEEDKLNIPIDQEESHPLDSDNHDSTPGWTIQKPTKQLAAEQQKTQEQNDQPSIKPQIAAVNPFDMLRDSMIDDSYSSSVSLQKSQIGLEDPLSLFMQDGAQITSSKGSKKKKKKTTGENSSKPPAIAFEQISQFYVKAEPKNPFLPQKKETTSDADQGQDFFSGF